MSAADAEWSAPVPDDAPHLLLVDDDSRIRGLLARYLGDQGFRVTVASSAAEARGKLDGLAFDLLILDVMMPGESGLDLARSVRAMSDVPILFLSANGDSDDRIRGLEIGADDYVAKPFEPRELVLRIGRILQRVAPPQPGQNGGGEVRFGGYAFHLGRGELRAGGDFVRLTERQRALLTLLAQRGGESVSRLELAGIGGGGERAVDVQINRIRRKIEADPANPLLLQTVRGTGYRLLVET